MTTSSTTMAAFAGEAYARRTSSTAFLVRGLQGSAQPAALFGLASTK